MFPPVDPPGKITPADGAPTSEHDVSIYHTLVSDETWRIAIGWVGEDVRAARIRRPADGANAIFRSPEEVLDHALAALQEKEHKRKASKPRKNLAQFLMESPLAGAELNLERQNDYGRPVKL